MFPRAHNRRLSHRLYAREAEWLEQRCEEQGIEPRCVSPWKTSQFCRFCGKWDRRSRSGKVFRCVHCGHRDDADMNGVQNIRLLGLAGVYSLRSLPDKFIGNILL
ncbi:MAG: transposase [Thermoplasmata archaeon]|nr:transposase [Candidatus Sysuiplasma jiujiangense]MBX8642846.1 transposase [Candidatus Sysuiplasma jiujiangense]